MKLPALLFICTLLLTGCENFPSNKKKEEKDTPVELATKSVLLLAVSTSGRCQINSGNNPEYFSPNTTPQGGSVPVGRVTSQVGNVSLDIYYPQDNSTSLPVLVLFQGGNVHSSFYSKYAARLASAGYVVYVGQRCDLFIVQYFIYPPESLGNIVLQTSEVQNADSSSPLFKKMDTTKLGFLGHSLGGVVGLFAMNNICESPFCDGGYKFMTQVKAGIFYGSGLGGNFSNSRFYTNNGKGIPTGYIQGSNDGANKPESGLASYKNAIPTKVYFTVEGANHYGITDVTNPTGANPESVSATISQADQISRISESSILFLDAYIKSNATSLAKITSNSAGITNVSITSEQ